ncbi:Organic cation transporter, partial [Operophtera brumata]
MAESRKGSMGEPASTGPSRKESMASAGPSRKASRPERSGSVSAPKALDLDDVLVNELGQFGWFQLYNICLVAFPIIASAFMSEYIFSAAAIPHRCQIPECGETTKDHSFETDWLSSAIPESASGFASCERFAPVNGANGTLDYCPASFFTASTQQCDGFVYARDNSVVVGTLLVLPIIGFISDRFGRRVALVISVFNLGLIGLIRAFSVNYPMYLTLQILQTTLGAGTYSSAYIFAAEMVGPKYRVVTGATSSSMFAVGQVILGSVAWLVQPWRYMIMALHIPCFLIIAYYWLLSESVRWLLSKRKYAEARTVLEKVARFNKKQISEKSLESLTNPPSAPPS